MSRFLRTGSLADEPRSLIGAIHYPKSGMFSMHIKRTALTALLVVVVRRERTLDFAGMFSLIQESDKRENCQTRMFFSYFEANAWVTSDSSKSPIERHLEDDNSRSASGDG